MLWAPCTFISHERLLYCENVVPQTFAITIFVTYRFGLGAISQSTTQTIVKQFCMKIFFEKEDCPGKWDPIHRRILQILGSLSGKSFTLASSWSRAAWTCRSSEDSHAINRLLLGCLLKQKGYSNSRPVAGWHEWMSQTEGNCIAIPWSSESSWH